MNLSKYQTLVFDCDGVILNSNKVKTDAFYKAALPYGKFAAQALVEFHVARGGVSRYKKFEWFVDHVVAGKSGPSLEQLLMAYAKEVQLGLLTCEIAEGMVELREQTKHANWLIVSGGDQQELREIFFKRDIAKYFDGGIFGSPDSKDVILSREVDNNNIKLPSLFLGDSKYDYQAADLVGLDFIFLSDWSELPSWRTWVSENNLKSVSSLCYLSSKC